MFNTDEQLSMLQVHICATYGKAFCRVSRSYALLRPMFVHMITSLSDVNGSWSNYGQWSSCSGSCGGATRFRQRSCTNPCQRGNGDFCPGNRLEVEICNNTSCGKYSLNWLQLNLSNQFINSIAHNPLKPILFQLLKAALAPGRNGKAAL